MTNNRPFNSKKNSLPNNESVNYEYSHLTNDYLDLKINQTNINSRHISDNYAHASQQDKRAKLSNQEEAIKSNNIQDIVLNISNKQIVSDYEEDMDESKTEGQGTNILSNEDELNESRRKKHEIDEDNEYDYAGNEELNTENINGIENEESNEDKKENKDSTPDIELDNTPTQHNNTTNSLYKQNESSSMLEDRVLPTSFICHALLGKGSFGEVYLVEKISNKTLYAMKVLSKDRIMGKY
jgi:hypothetical protein